MSLAAKPPLARLRAAAQADLSAVVKVEQANYEFPWTLGMFRDCLAAGYELWLLERDGDLLGYGVLSAAGGEAHLLNLCIADVHQRQGHARRLLARLIDLARWHHAERMFLEVRPSNPRALDLYLSFGFSEVGRRPGYYPARQGREDAIVMALQLAVNERWPPE